MHERYSKPMIGSFKIKITSFIFILVISVTGCVSLDSVDKKGNISKAVVKLNPTDGNTANGVVWFTNVVGGVKVEGHIEGLRVGIHGFHIHQFGDCSASNGKSAGGHLILKGASMALQWRL